jgi:hypothetical protein
MNLTSTQIFSGALKPELWSVFITHRSWHPLDLIFKEERIINRVSSRLGLFRYILFPNK